MLNTKHDLIALAKKLRAKIDCKLKFSLPTCFQTQPTVSYCPKKNKAFSASTAYENDRSKKKLCVCIVINREHKKV